MEWGGKCGEGKVTLTGTDHGKHSYIELKGVKSGKWKEECKGFCKHFEKLEIKGCDSLRVNYGVGWIGVVEGKIVTLTSERCKEMKWKGNGQVKWEGGEVECACFELNNCEQTVTRKGAGSVGWRGKGKATWVGGKLEKWKGSQTVRYTDDRPVVKTL